MFLEAESYFFYEEYKEALPLYIRLSVIYPNNDNINYRIGRCYLNIPYEKQKSIQYLEIAIKNINVKHKGETLKETAAPPDAMYYLADAYRINNRLENALGLYKKFKSLTNPAIFDHNMIDHQISACENAMMLQKTPVKVSFKNIGEGINTRFSESNAVVSGDESILIYSSQLQFYTAVFYSVNQNGAWSTPVNINPDLEVDDDCFPVGISYDGKELFLYRSNEFLGDLFVSRFINGKWSKVKKLNNKINTRFWESHACVTRDGKKLYFTSNRKESFGGLDIFVSSRTDVNSDNWSEPVNLGPTINSEYNEETPFITADGQKLYFSSPGHNSMGGYDIFVSEYRSGKWGIPQNLGYPLNTTDNDMFYQPVREGDMGYMAMYQSNSYGRDDIYKVEISTSPNELVAINSKLKVSERKAETSLNTLSPHETTKQNDSHISSLPQENNTTIEVTNTSSQNEVEPSETDTSPDSNNQTENTDKKQKSSLDDSTLTPGQKEAWHKLLYGGLAILSVFVFFILFLFLRSKKRKNKV